MKYHDGSEHFKKMPIYHQRAIRGYTYDWYEGLAEAKILNTATKQQDNYLSLVDDALNNAPKKYVGEVGRSLRGMSANEVVDFIDRHSRAMNSGEAVTSHTPASWKRGKNGAWYNAQIELRMKRTTKGVYTNPIAHYHGSSEDEVTIPTFEYYVKDIYQEGNLWVVEITEK